MKYTQLLISCLSQGSGNYIALTDVETRTDFSVVNFDIDIKIKERGYH